MIHASFHRITFACLLLAAAFLTLPLQPSPPRAAAQATPAPGIAAPAAPATLPATAPAETDANREARLAAEKAWKEIAAVLGDKGQLRAGILTLTFPRTDLNVNVDGMPIPTEAGIESQLRFFRCPCGKTVLVGQFCVTDYEADDVLDALHGGDVKVASLNSMFISDRPHLMLIRVHGEGSASDLAKPLKAALDQIGEARNATTQPGSGK